MKFVLAIALFSITSSLALAQGAFSVSGQCNLWGAGHAIPPNPGGGGRGLLPVMIPIPPDAIYVQLLNVQGQIAFGPQLPFNNAEGVNGGNCFEPSLNGISGWQGTKTRDLHAIFLNATEPTDPAPASLAISDYSFTSLNPALQQQFFVGDGLASASVNQRFFVPAGATRMFFGVCDFINCGDLPGFFEDNLGAFTGYVTINGLALVTQQPATAVTCPGGSASFTIDSVSADARSYRWQIEMTPNIWFQLNDGTLDISGSSCGTAANARTPTLSLSSICIAANGKRFRCAITTPNGTINSAPAVLNVCPANFNCDGAVDFFDYLDFVDAFASNQPTADFNADSVIDFFDYLDFVDAFSTGC